MAPLPFLDRGEPYKLQICICGPPKCPAPRSCSLGPRISFCIIFGGKNDRPPRSEGFLFEGVANFQAQEVAKRPPVFRRPNFNLLLIEPNPEIPKRPYSSNGVFWYFQANVGGKVSGHGCGKQRPPLFCTGNPFESYGSDSFWHYKFLCGVACFLNL